MTRDLISIVMPVWNPDILQLKLSIESVLKQTYSELELIIIYKKSMSTDSDVNKVFDESRGDHRIRVIESNSGFVEALNLGVKMSGGTKIGRMDSDDISASTRLEEQNKFMLENEVSILGSWAYSISQKGEVIGTIEPPYKSEDIRKKIMFHSPILHPSVLMEKKMLNEIGYYDSKFYGAEDYELYLRAISKNYKIANIPKHLIYLREVDSSIMRGKQWKSTRKSYIKAKNTALLHYGFNRYYDIFYCLFTPMTIFIPPKMAYKVKNTIGWNKEITSE